MIGTLIISSPVTCGCAKYASDFLRHPEEGVYQCTYCQVIYTKSLKSDWIDIRRNRDYGGPSPVLASFHVDDPDPAMTILTGRTTGAFTRCKEDFPVRKYSLSTPLGQPVRKYSLSTPLGQLDSKISDLAKPDGRKRYEEAYWKFVNSVTHDDAACSLDKMLSEVTMDLEPAGKDWSSWVADPVITEERSIPGHILDHLGSYSFCITVTILSLIMLLVFTGVI